MGRHQRRRRESLRVHSSSQLSLKASSWQLRNNDFLLFPAGHTFRTLSRQLPRHIMKPSAPNSYWLLKMLPREQLLSKRLPEMQPLYFQYYQYLEQITRLFTANCKRKPFYIPFYCLLTVKYTIEFYRRVIKNSKHISFKVCERLVL